MNLHLHQTHHQIGDWQAAFEQSRQALEGEEGLHVFPECSLTGYPLKDLCLKQPFIDAYLALLARLEEHCRSLPERPQTGVLVGGPHYRFEEGALASIENAVFFLTPGQGLTKVYAKRSLPAYDIFDEPKYFTPGTQSPLFRFGGKTIALSVCEDAWPTRCHLPHQRVLEELIDRPPDLVVNLAASPYSLGKPELRRRLGMELSQSLGAPVAMVNRVGGEDELLFDGNSFLACADSIVARLAAWEADSITCPWPAATRKKALKPKPWNPFGEEPPLRPLGKEHLQELCQAIPFGLKEYARKCGPGSFLVGLSGGVDSALVLSLALLACPDKVEALFLPGRHTSEESFELAQQLCRRLGVKLHHLPIKFLHAMTAKAHQECFGRQPAGVVDENIQARLRGLLLYARSNQTGAMVLNTSNRSELAVGYSTLYGDSVGALSPIGDLYKSEVFQLAGFLADMIPPDIVRRSPSAELRPHQTDQDSLPPYEVLDAILAGSTDHPFDPATVSRVKRMVAAAEHKRRQFCPILKLRPISFGQGHRMPLTQTTLGESNPNGQTQKRAPR